MGIIKIRLFKCPNCKREHEVKEEEYNKTKIILCCGCLSEMKEVFK